MALTRYLSTISNIFSRLSAALSKSGNLHNARFALPHETAYLHSPTLDKETSLLLGEGRFNQIARVRPTSNRRELGNMLLVAPTRAGKGLMAISQLLTWKDSIVVNDIKGELYTATAGYRARLGKVFVIDPTGIGHRLDPLTGARTEDEFFSSATRLLYKPDEGEGQIFTQRAIVMLTQLLLAARMEDYPPLPYVRQRIRDGLLASAATLDTISPELATQFLDMPFTEANFDDRFLLSAWGTLSARMRPLLTETVIRSLAGSDFNVSDLMTKDEPITVYLRWPERDLLALSPLVRLLWGSLIDTLITTYDQKGGKNCHPVLLLLDEAGRTAIPSLADHATTVVGRGISLWVAIQSLSQLEAVYGRARANILRDNMETQIYYRPSDTQTARYLEERLGSVSAYAHSQTLHSGEETSEGRSERPIPLLASQDIAQLPDDAVIAFHRNLPAIRLKRMDWRRFAILKKRQAIPAPPLKPLPVLSTNSPTTIWQRAGEGSSTYLDPDKRN